MAKGVEIPITAIDQATQTVDKVDASLNRLQGTQAQGTATAKASTLGWTELNSAVMLGEKVINAAGQAYEKTVVATMKYAEQVRDLAAVSGENTENTSRFIQLLDDYQLTAEDAMIATKALTKQGLRPNIATLAELSDKYNSLNSVEEKNAFIIKNLGRGGLEWARVLKLGSAAIKEQGAAISDKLVLSGKDAAQSEKLRLGQDALNDSIMALQIAIGKELIPTLIDATDELTDMTEWVGDNYEEVKKWGNVITWIVNPLGRLGLKIGEMAHGTKDAADATSDAVRPTHEYGESLEGVAASAEEVEAEMKASEERIKAAQKALEGYEAGNANFIESIMKLTDMNRDYGKSQDDIKIKMGETQDAIDKLLKEGWWPESDKVKDLQKDYDDLSAKYDENAAEHERRKDRILLDMTLEKIAMLDGVKGFTDAEAEKALAVAKTLGAAEEASVREQIAFQKVSSAVADGTLKIEDMQQVLKDLTNHDWSIGVAIRAESMQELRDLLRALQAANPGRTYPERGRAVGGPVSADTPYMVGERGPEMFIPNQSGRIIPNSQLNTAGGGGSSMSINVTVNAVGNPDPESLARQLAPAIRRVMREERVI